MTAPQNRPAASRYLSLQRLSDAHRWEEVTFVDGGAPSGREVADPPFLRRRPYLVERLERRLGSLLRAVGLSLFAAPVLVLFELVARGPTFDGIFALLFVGQVVVFFALLDAFVLAAIVAFMRRGRPPRIDVVPPHSSDSWLEGKRDPNHRRIEGTIRALSSVNAPIVLEWWRPSEPLRIVGWESFVIVGDQGELALLRGVTAPLLVALPEALPLDRAIGASDMRQLVSMVGAGTRQGALGEMLVVRAGDRVAISGAIAPAGDNHELEAEVRQALGSGGPYRDGGRTPPPPLVFSGTPDQPVVLRQL